MRITATLPLNVLFCRKLPCLSSSLQVASSVLLSTNQSQGSGAIQRHINQGIDSELVLDVPQGTAVIFRRRESNRISQLWRMTAAGQLEHMGSAFMRRSERRQLMVLDITDDSRSRTCIPLVIRKLDRARASTQTWKFDAVRT